MIHHWFRSRTGLQTFIILIVGLLILQIAVLFIFTLHERITDRHFSGPRLTQEIIRTIFVTQALPATEKNQIEKLILQPGLVAKITQQPEKKSTILTQITPKTIAKSINNQSNHLSLSVLLNNGQWLNIHWHSKPEQHLLWGLKFILALLLIAMCLLCWWTIRRMAAPWQKFTVAAERFGQDMQAPPMAEVGTHEMRTAIHAFNAMQNRIRHLMNDRTQMLAAISHDLRTPLTRLQLRAEYLQGTPQYEKALADLKEMEKMITSILFFARNDTRDKIKERFDLNALLVTLRDNMIDANHTVIYHEHSKRIPFFGNLIEIRRALTNLIDNAVQYGQQAEITLIQQKKQLSIKIEDQGPGIPHTDMERVFEPFYRIDPARSPQNAGTGLGLAITRDIIRAHGGDITLQNRKIKGLTVMVTFLFSHASL